jgi:hypothetical protein
VGEDLRPGAERAGAGTGCSPCPAPPGRRCRRRSDPRPRRRSCTSSSWRTAAPAPTTCPCSSPCRGTWFRSRSSARPGPAARPCSHRRARSACRTGSSRRCPARCTASTASARPRSPARRAPLLSRTRTSLHRSSLRSPNGTALTEVGQPLPLTLSKNVPLPVPCWKATDLEALRARESVGERRPMRLYT